jgi:hypothetical protein
VNLSSKAKVLAKLVAETDEDFGPAYRAVSDELKTRPSVGALDEAAATIFEYATRTTDPERETNLFLITGAMVEHGGDPTIGWTHLLSRIAAAAERLAGVSEQLVEQRVNLDSGTSSTAFDRDLRALIGSFRYLVMAAMARMARRPDLRNEARSNETLLRNVATFQNKCPSNHGYFLREVLNLFDGQLVIIDVTSQAVELWQVEAIRNCAHLIAMLDGVDARKLAETPGAVHQVEHHYTSFGSLDEVAEGLLRAKRLRSVDWMFMLGVDRLVRQIPALEVPALGKARVVVKAPKRFTRSFAPSEAFAPIHDECIERATSLRTISGSERSSLVSTIVHAARQLRKGLGRTDGATSFPPELMQHPLWLAHWDDHLP